MGLERSRKDRIKGGDTRKKAVVKCVWYLWGKPNGIADIVKNGKTESA